MPTPPAFPSVPDVPAPLPHILVPPPPSAEPAPAPAVPDVEAVPDADADFPGPTTTTPLRGVRKLVAARMQASLANHAQLTLSTSAPAVNLLNLRRRLKGSDPTFGMRGVTIGDLMAFAAVQVARQHPGLNATVADNVLTTYTEVHLGLAVDTPRGLVVPTVRHASRMGLRRFSAEAKALAAAARTGAVNPDLLAGATFTVTNLGSFGIEAFTPILNSPQVAILGVDTVFPRPALGVDGSYGVEQRIGFSLTVDHAVVDGADAARFLADLVTLVADIDIAVLD